jgi:hypothetical protein
VERHAVEDGVTFPRRDVGGGQDGLDLLECVLGVDVFAGLQSHRAVDVVDQRRGAEHGPVGRRVVVGQSHCGGEDPPGVGEAVAGWVGAEPGRRRVGDVDEQRVHVRRNDAVRRLPAVVGHARRFRWRGLQPVVIRRRDTGSVRARLGPGRTARRPSR